MKRIFIIIFTILALFIANNVNAISPLTKAPVLNTSSATTLDISWDKNPNAMGYYVYYSKVSGKDYNSFGDAFPENKTTITNLQPNTTYYVVVTSFDAENNESFYSPEGVFNTKSFSEKFGLTEIKPINFNELELIFNSSLDAGSEAIREFKITQNNKEIVTVKESKINEKEDNKLNLILDKNLTPGEYKLTIIYITDKTGRNIEEGIDGETKFVIPASFSLVEQTKVEVVKGDLVNNLINNLETTENNSASEIPQEEKNLELNSGDIVGEDGGLAGKSISGALSTSEVVVDKNKKLPQTGPESIFILFMAMLISGVAFYLKKRTV